MIIIKGGRGCGKSITLYCNNTHDENGIPKCCMTCAYWSFRSGRKCNINVGDLIKYGKVCPEWEISDYYKGGKQ